MSSTVMTRILGLIYFYGWLTATSLYGFMALGSAVHAKLGSMLLVMSAVLWVAVAYLKGIGEF